MLVRRSIIGSTLATVTFNKNANKILLTWVGDSQVILKLRSQTYVYQTSKHLISPNQDLPDSIQSDSIINDRLGGILRLSRAVCDYPLKQMGLTAQCDSETFDASDIEFGIVCSDGITDVIQPETLMDICKKLLFDHDSLDTNLRWLLEGNVEQYKENL